MPIALDKKYTHDKRIIFVPSENPPDDPSGTVIFTRHGFFEIPKEKNAPSKFVSKRNYVMESYYFDVFSKLPFTVNFYKRKFICKWLREARKSCYNKKKKIFSQAFWGSK